MTFIQKRVVKTNVNHGTLDGAFVSMIVGEKSRQFCSTQTAMLIKYPA
jgi:hypothetical protein